MIGPDKDELYKKGRDPILDKRYMQYKKLKIFAGDAVNEALSDKEGDMLVTLWCKENVKPWRMTTQEIKQIVEFSERVIFWRKNRRREKTRIRVVRLRKKVRNAANNGDVGAAKKTAEYEKEGSAQLFEVSSAKT